MKRLLLIDGDEFIFRATAAIERETRWDDQNHVLYANENEAWKNLTTMFERIFERFETDKHALCFSLFEEGKPNFRTLVDSTYKNNRAGSRKPLCYAALRERVDSEYKTRAYPGLEADDVMGILATSPTITAKSQPIIVSQDKDMKTVPATVWNGKDLMHIAEPEADYWHLYQTLVGDTSDGYKGCPAIGPVKAEKLLSFAGAEPLARDVMWSRVVDAYTKAGLTEEDALTQARLARILRWSDWDAIKKEPILWTPTGQSTAA